MIIPPKFTFLCERGKSTIDLVWSNFIGLHAIVDFEVKGIHTGSDHFPINLKLVAKVENKELDRELNVYKWKNEL